MMANSLFVLLVPFCGWSRTRRIRRPWTWDARLSQKLHVWASG